VTSEAPFNLFLLEMIMRNTASICLVVAVTTVVASGAYAAEKTSQPASPTAQQAASTDFGALSAQGAQAYRDIQLTRLAIFNADPVVAKRMIEDASKAIGKAQHDDAIFVKAEADLKQPKTMPANSHPDKSPVAWLPVDAQMVLDENYIASPQKASALDEANKSVKKGDRKAAIDKLKLAGINVDVTVAVVPLAKTTAAIDNAVTLISDGKY
jgi:hypothetical protein